MAFYFFSNFLYLPQITQYNFFIFLLTENILVLLYNSSYIHQEKINLYTPISFYLKIKSHKINKPSTKGSTYFWIICLYFINICYNIFISNEFSNFVWSMFNSKTMLHFQHPHTKQFKEFLLIHTHQDLTYMLHPLLYIDYFLNKHN